MKPDSYLNWLVAKTRTKWWHDSCSIAELELAMQHGASGVTTNPVLNYKEAAALAAKDPGIISRIACSVPPEQKVEAVVRHLVSRLVPYLQAEHEKSGGADGYVCAQVNPKKATDKAAMVATARFYRALAANIAVKLPVTRAGLAAMEEVVAEGIPIVATVGFTAAQLVAVAEVCERGLDRAQQKGIPTPPTYAVMMIGRLDDYLRDVAQESGANVRENDLRQAGLAVTKRAYELYRERGYATKLIVAALRGNYHMVELAGAEVVMSIHPRNQGMLLDSGVVREERIENPVDAESLKRLMTMKEFVRAYEPDGLAPSEFLSYGVTQRTITQFVEGGWALIEGL